MATECPDVMFSCSQALITRNRVRGEDKCEVWYSDSWVTPHVFFVHRYRALNFDVTNPKVQKSRHGFVLFFILNKNWSISFNWVNLIMLVFKLLFLSFNELGAPEAWSRERSNLDRFPVPYLWLVSPINGFLRSRQLIVRCPGAQWCNKFH